MLVARDESEETVGSRIRAIRRKRKKSQAWLAHQVGITSQAIGQIENGQITPSVKRAEQIAEALGVRPGTLFSRKRPDEKRCQPKQEGAA